MSMTIGQFLVWIVIGAISGTLAGVAVTRSKQGFGLPGNLLLGMFGAVIGGFLFRLIGILPDLDALSVSVRDIVSAVVGSLIVLGALWLKNRQS